MHTPDIIKDLVKRFGEHRDVYRSGKYKKAHEKESLQWEIESCGRRDD